MNRKEHWRLNKFTKLVVCQFLATGSCLLVILFYSPLSETLLQVNRERLVLYSMLYGLSCLLAGEVIGLFVNNYRELLWKRLVLSFASTTLGSLGLILAVWTIEFEFVGRLAIFKIVATASLAVFLFLNFLSGLNRRNPWRVLPVFKGSTLSKIKHELSTYADQIDWFEYNDDLLKGDLVAFTKAEGIDIVIVDDGSKGTDVMGLLSSGVRVMGVAAFWETFGQKIPHAEIDRSWLTKLDLRQRDPLVRRIKRLTDLFVSFSALILTLPILLFCCVAIAVDSGFPIFFKQTRSGFLGRPYVLYKLRTMKRNSESEGAQWAKDKDKRITIVGRFLRKTRIDEIPQFWNVIKGEMSVVGPRPERPELEQEIIQKLPYWNCRYLLKPGITGWAQIKYQYAFDIKSSDEKLSYDLFYVKNASFFLDLEIILSTLRSLMKGSR